ncbi:MAG TPA: xanthine dehydrogenase family protein subunit M [Noviherbaspirillum sp.]
MKPAAFSYHRPSSLDEALERLATCGETAKVIAGGQSLGPMMNMRLATPSALIDLNDLTEFAYIRERGDALEIGALTRHHQIEESALVKRRCPLLAEAARTIGHYAIRQRGTLGGSLAHADPAAQLALVAVTLGAQIDVISVRGRRTIPASEFFLSVMATALHPDEVILAVRFPVAREQEGCAFQLFNRRHGDFAIVAVAATIALREDRIEALRLGVAGTGPVAVSHTEIAAHFVGETDDGDWIAEMAYAVRDAVNPDDDARIPAVYRKELTATVVQRALAQALSKAKG